MWRIWSMLHFIQKSFYITSTPGCILPYFGKRKQVTKVKFLVKEQNVSVISTAVNEISCPYQNIYLWRMSVYA